MWILELSNFINLSLLQIRHLWRLLYKKTALAVFSEVGFSVGALTRWQRVTTERWVLQNAADGWRLDVTVPQSPLWVTSLGDLYVWSAVAKLNMQEKPFQCASPLAPACRREKVLLGAAVTALEAQVRVWGFFYQAWDAEILNAEKKHAVIKTWDNSLIPSNI